MTLNELRVKAINKGLIPYINSRTVSNAYRRLLSDPGDCEGDTALLVGSALAEAYIGKGPGWIPEVQKLGCEIADLYEE